MPAAADKSPLRALMLERRLALPQKERLQAEQALLTLFTESPIFSRFSSMAGYMPMRGEVDIRPIMTFMSTIGIRISLPCIEPDGRMVFRRWHPGDPLLPGKHRIPEPVGGEEMIPGLVLMPLLAADLQGGRLGAGGGYYDRTLASAPYRGCYRMGVGYRFQLLPLLPSEPHDVTLHAFASEDGIMEFGNHT